MTTKAGDVGERIKLARGALGLSQEQVARAINATRAVICYWEKGLGLPGKNFREPLAKTLQVSLAFIMAGEGERPPKPKEYEKRRISMTALALRNMLAKGEFDEIILPRVEAMLDTGKLDAKLRKRGWRRD
jgi:transcriptional regulator with XRE-family HTH domain